MAGDFHSPNSSAKLTVEYKDMKCLSQSEVTSLRIKTEEGETITFPDSFQYSVVKQEPQDWSENQSGQSEIVLWEGEQSCEKTEPIESAISSSECEEGCPGVKPNVACYSEFNKDSDTVDTLDTYECTESDLGPVEEWSEEVVSRGCSFQHCKIKEESADIKKELGDETQCDSHGRAHNGNRLHECNGSERRLTERVALRRRMLTRSGGHPHNVAKQSRVTKEGDHCFSTSDPADFLANSSECEEQLQRNKPNIPCYPGLNQDSDNMDTVQTYQCTERISSDIEPTKGWSEETFPPGVSLQDCKIKEEPGNFGQSEISCQIFSGDSSAYKEEGENNMRGCQSGENFSAQPESSLQHVETQTERETQTDEWLEEDMEDINRKPDLLKTDKERFFCPLCQKSFSSRYSVQRHEQVHTGVKSFVCEVCGKGVGGKANMQRHMLAHTRAKHECDFCKKQFKKKSKLRQHMLKHTGEKPHKCDLCGKYFRERFVLRKHMLTHTGEKPHKCDLCEKQFRERITLQRHIRTHTGEKPHICNLCEKRFSQISSLLRHMVTHTGEKTHSCDICERLFLQKTNLQRHMLIHTKENPYACDVCKKGFRDRSKLRKHVSTHTGERHRPHKCDVCEKGFTERSTLCEHMVIHTGEKPHKCKLCGKQFGNRSSLRTHMLTHSEEKPHKCNLCEKQFKLSVTLRRHTLTHTDNKPYACTLCTKSYIQSSHLSTHMLTHRKSS